MTEVIVLVGRKATENLFKLYDMDEEIEDTFAKMALRPKPGSSDVSIIPSYHLSNYTLNAHHISKEQDESSEPVKVNSVDEINKDTYLLALAEQIAKSSEELELIE